MSAYPITGSLPAEAQPIIDRYAVLCDPTYYERLRLCIGALRDAAESIDRAAGQFSSCPMDSGQWSEATEMSPLLMQTHNCAVIHRQMLEHVGYYENLALAIQASTSLTEADVKKKGMSIPEQVYIDATNELITIYEVEVGTVSYPDARARHLNAATQTYESTQPSTHFIARCLAAIDGRCDLEMAVTCIKKARDWGRVEGTNFRMGDGYPSD
jgi:hypothetical protein